MRLHHAIIFVKDLDRMAGFYEAGLGLAPVNGSRTDSWAEFQAGGASVALHAIPAHMAEGIEIADPPRAREENAIKLTFEVADLAAAKSRLQAHGARLIERPWGACDAIDPEGNVFQIYQA